MKKRSKKILSVTLAMLMLLSCIPFSGIAEKAGIGSLAVKSDAEYLSPGLFYVFWEEEAEEEESVITNFTFSLNDDCNSYSVTGYYDFYTANVTLPSTYNGKPVTAVNAYAISFHNEIKSITIPSSITTLEYCWAVSLENLQSIVVENGNTAYSSEDGVLFNADKSSLIWYPSKKTGTSYTVPSTVKTIADGAFAECSTLTSIILPEGLGTIGENAFNCCTSLKSISIPDSVTTVGDYAFFGCSNVKTISIGSGLNSIGETAFYCENLQSFTVDSDNKSFSSENGVLFNKDKTKLIKYPEAKTDTSYTVPLTVIEIGDSSFDGVTFLTSITLQNNVTTIEDYAFCCCSGLTSFTVPANVTTIGDCAFRVCESLSEFSVASENTAFSTQDGVLFNKDKTELVAYPLNKAGTSYVVPSSVKKISSGAFIDNEKLTSISLPNTLTTICEYSFSWSEITSITIPSSATSIGNSAFESCSKLVSAVVHGTNLTLGECAFEDCSVLSSLTLDSGVTNIGVEAFSGCKSLTDVTLPNTVSSIGVYAFSNCTNLKTIVIPGSVKTIEMGTFSSCVNLENLTISNGVNSIGEYAFYTCKALETVVLPDSVTNIGEASFYQCKNLSNITIPASVTSIGDDAFELTNVTIHCILNSTAHNYAVKNKLNYVTTCPHINKVSKPTVPATCLTAGKEACVYCPDCGEVLSGGAEIPKSTEHKDSNNDGYCDWCSTQLSDYVAGAPFNITVEAGEKNYVMFTPNVSGTYTFESFSDGDTTGYLYDETKTTELTMDHDSGTGWNFKVTYNLEKGKTYYFAAEYYNSETFGSFDASITLEAALCEHTNTVAKAEIPATCLSEGYEAGTYCNDCKTYISGGNVIEQLEHTDENQNDICDLCGHSFFEYEVEDGKASITGYSGLKTNITVPVTIDGYTVTSIADTAFLNNSSLTDITLPASVKVIGDNAFAGCSSLVGVTMPEGVETIGSEAFYNCTSLISAVIPDSVTLLGYGVFSDCGNLNSVSIGKGIKSIGQNTFQYCSSLESVTIPANVESIGYYAFFDCSALKTVTMGDGVKTIGESAFDSCVSLEDVKIPSSLKTISDYTFSNCTELDGISIPAGVETIGDGAFNGCTNLSYVHLGSGIKTIGDYAFCDCTALRGLTVPRTVTSLGEGFLQGCELLEKLTIPFVGPNAVTENTAGEYNLGYFFGTDPYSWCKNTKQYYYCDTDGEGNFSSEYKEYYIPKSLKEIGYTGTFIPFGAFYNCSTIEKVTLVNGLTEISNEAFISCTSLTDINIPSTVKTLEYECFAWCSALEEITLPEGITSIVLNAFASCTKLKSINIPDSVVSLGNGVFANCTSLESVKIGKGITGIPTYTFISCSKLNNVKIPMNVTSLGEGSFAGCSSLNYIEIPTSVTSIDGTAFYNSPYIEFYGFSDSYAYIYATTVRVIPFHELDFIVKKGDVYAYKDEGVDTGSKVIILNEDKITDISDIALINPLYELVIITDNVEIPTNYIGTGTIIAAKDSDKAYAIIIRGDLNGDGVCDVLDASVAERLTHATYSIAETKLYAANGSLEDETISVQAYSYVVNRALA